MKARIEPDALDLERLKETVESPGYELIRRRAAETRGRRATELESLTELGNVRFVQGFLAGLDNAFAIPKILADEFRARKKE